MSLCYICSNNNEIVLYYDLQNELYIDPKTYQEQITQDLKQICNKCVINLILTRHTYFACTSCKCYTKDISKDINEFIQFSNYHLCKKCIDKIQVDNKGIENEHESCSNCKEVYDKYSDNMSWAIFFQDNIFSYGSSGEFKLISDNFHFKRRDRLCSNCLKSMKYEEYLGVECEVCHNKYKSLISGHHNFGHTCSAMINDTSICASYGSNYEEQKVKFVTGRSVDLEFGAICCDNCISRLISDGICFLPKDKSEPNISYTI